MDCVVGIERRKILSIVADLRSWCDFYALRMSRYDRLQEGTLSDTIGTGDEEVLIFPQGDVGRFCHGLVVAYDGV